MINNATLAASSYGDSGWNQQTDDELKKEMEEAEAAADAFWKTTPADGNWTEWQQEGNALQDAANKSVSAYWAYDAGKWNQGNDYSTQINNDYNSALQLIALLQSQIGQDAQNLTDLEIKLLP